MVLTNLQRKRRENADEFGADKKNTTRGRKDETAKKMTERKSDKFVADNKNRTRGKKDESAKIKKGGDGRRLMNL